MGISLDIFKQNQISCCWKTVYAGLKTDLLKPSEVASYAVEYLTNHPETNDQNIIQLAWGEEDTDFENLLAHILEKLDVEDLDLDADIWHIEKRKWRFALLASLKARYQNDLEELLDKVAEVYADFDYPEDMESFINYLAPPEGFDPSQYTKEENVNRLITLFDEFLNMERQYLQQAAA
ncbi:DUF2247 family protein [Sporosarcina sp. 179-K 3D1 HS]|uniref:DUF2247 family protein n=1 Tax=Sporosarcina sp. 179-K 3D1 HS TaxID=3232169 RepID=UPI0039A2D32C